MTETDWKRPVFIPIPKKGNARECSNYRKIALISHAGKVMLKILQARLQQYMNWEPQDGQADLEKAEEPEIANIHWIIEKAKELQKNIYFCLIGSAKAFNCVDHNKLWKILKEMGTPDHFTYLLRYLYAGQEAMVSTGHGTWTGSKLGRVHQRCIQSPCLFNLYAEYIMQNARLDEAQTGIKIAGRNINNVRYTDHAYGKKWRGTKILLMIGVGWKSPSTLTMAAGEIRRPEPPGALAHCPLIRVGMWNPGPDTWRKKKKKKKKKSCWWRWKRRVKKLA